MVILWLRYGYVMVLSAKWPYIVRYLSRIHPIETGCKGTTFFLIVQIYSVKKA